MTFEDDFGVNPYTGNPVIKSQDDLNKPAQHSTDVLIKALEKSEKLEKQLKIAIKCLRDYAFYGTKDSWFAKTALEQIKELNND